jgi:hypothetical protein
MEALARSCEAEGDHKEAREYREHARKWLPRCDRNHRKELGGEALSVQDLLEL